MTPRIPTDKEMDLLKELRWRMDSIKDDFERAVYYYICVGFQEFKYGKREIKQVTKEQLLKYLVRKGLMRERADGSLPDDRKVREAASRLLRRGLPIIATAHKKGYFVAESPEEINVTRREYRSRINRMLDVEKGCDAAVAMLIGQGRIFGA